MATLYAIRACVCIPPFVIPTAAAVIHIRISRRESLNTPVARATSNQLLALSPLYCYIRLFVRSKEAAKQQCAVPTYVPYVRVRACAPSLNRLIDSASSFAYSPHRVQSVQAGTTGSGSSRPESGSSAGGS